MKAYDKNIFKGEQFVQKKCNLHLFMLPFCQQNPPKSPIFINDISYLFISFKGQDNTHESSKDPSSSFKKP
jgi:hypothetical protein